MKINPIQFNFIQNKPQNTVNRPLYKNNGLQTDVFTFRGKDLEEEIQEKMEKLVPKYKGTVYEKVKNKRGKVTDRIPVEVDIMKYSPWVFNFNVNGKEVGFVRMSYVPKEYCEKNNKHYDDVLHQDYEDYGITGERMEVEYLSNYEKDKYYGMGHLADLIEVAACKELGIKPIIVSVSTKEAAPFHYLRGKRFIPYERYCDEYELERHGMQNKDPNDIVKKIIKKARKSKKFDISELKIPPLMYMPKEMIKELEEELKEHPIF